MFTDSNKLAEFIKVKKEFLMKQIKEMKKDSPCFLQIQGQLLGLDDVLKMIKDDK